MRKSSLMVSATAACVTKFSSDSTFGSGGLLPQFSFGSAFRPVFCLFGLRYSSVRREVCTIAACPGD